MNSIETSADLTKVICATIVDVRSGNVTPAHGQAVAALAAQVVRTVRLEMDVRQLSAGGQSNVRGLPF